MLFVLQLAFDARAHIEMERPRPVTDSLKYGPCGGGPHERGTNVEEYSPGETIRVRWHETIDHPSTYRISFDEDGDDSFADPATSDDFYTNATVLLDEIPDEADGTYSVEVTLPAVECENCTLQLIQLMLDKPPYEPGTNDIYYQCADLALRGPPATGTDPTTDSGAAQEASGCGCGGSGGGASALLALPAAVALRRRRSVRTTA